MMKQRGSKSTGGQGIPSTVRFILPDIAGYLPHSSRFYLAGTFNGWNPHDPDYEFRCENGQWILNVTRPLGTVFEYKVSRGGWDRVETCRNASPNRVHTFDDPTQIVILDIEDWSDAPQLKTRHTITGNLRLLKRFHIPQLGRERTVRVWLPPHYEKGMNRYPVIYMQDGQYLFDARPGYRHEWKIDESITHMVEKGLTRGFIVVGVDNDIAVRTREYHPWDTSESPGEGEAYAAFVIETLKPFIDTHYRTKPDRENTAVMGASFGAIIAMYMGMRYADRISRVGAFSTALGLSAQPLANCCRELGYRTGTRVYIDTGSKEFDNPRSRSAYVDHAKTIHHMFTECGYPAKNLKLVIDPEGRHDELSWAQRFPGALLWLFDLGNH